MQILVAIPLADTLREEMVEAGHKLTVVLGEGGALVNFVDELAQVEGLLVNSHVSVDQKVIALAPNLKIVSTVSVGLDHIDLEAAKGSSVVVKTTPVLHDAVADLTLMLMTMLARRIPNACDLVRRGESWRAAPMGSDLARKTLFLIGFGQIGQTVASRANAAGMNVTYFDVRGDLGFLGATPVATLDAGLTQGDFVSVHVDLNDTTCHLMGAKEFAHMKPTAYLINTARGGVVDQAALVHALEAGVIAGAGLDVLEIEPPDLEDPILQAPNVIIVPHIGSATSETRAAMAQRAVYNLISYFQGS